ncbi:methyltransferase family protein [Actinocorallia herbida]|uniref:Methyltransferase family protein n=1 Tax=Actinocorallia herbida TaxID=58109 RepID=A0A3N1CXX3_9ACTN|nr:methyltransferase domain-containing protein [Actinocorallia herbida]ROO86095.1 methyltransferase family protein [Actinocorallia herbida]
MTTPLPFDQRDSANLPGRWLLARLGKRVLRPGGRELTERMLTAARLRDADVVELAPGLGKTALAILEHRPAGYRGVEADAVAAAYAAEVVGAAGTVTTGGAAATGLASGSADVVVGEAMLTMQTDPHKAEIIAEAFRVLRPGGRYAVHEMALRPDDIATEVKTDIRRALARSIKVNARPLTRTEWTELLAAAGFEIESVHLAPMALLQPRRVLADEGPRGTARILRNVLRDEPARQRVLAMRATFRAHQDALAAIAVIARKPTS